MTTKMTPRQQYAKKLLDGLFEDGIYYPESDDEPMADSPEQANTMTYIHEALKDWFIEDESVYVAMNMFLYYRRGDPRAVVAPDHYVIVGVDRDRPRLSWMTWREDGALPSFVLEIGSQRTHQYDAGGKRDLYASLGVGEYWRFDAIGDLFEPKLIGERLVDGEYQRMDVAMDASGILRGYSAVLGLDMCVLDNGELRLYDPIKREWLPTRGEAQAARRQAEAARRQVESDLERAQAEIRRLREMLAQASSDE